MLVVLDVADCGDGCVGETVRELVIAGLLRKEVDVGVDCGVG